MTAFKNLWGNNGDYISLQYAGHTSEMKDAPIERRLINDMCNATSKLFSINKFDENFKNNCINLLHQNETRGIFNKKIIQIL